MSWPKAAGERRCTATAKRSGERCARFAIIGGTVCPFHGGRAPQTRAAAERRAASAKAAKVMERRGIGQGRLPADPAEQLLDLIAAASWNVATYEAALEDMRTEVGAHGDRDTVVLELWGQGGTVTVSANALVKLYDDERERLAKWCVDARRCGVEERRVQITADQGHALAGALRGVVAGTLALVREALATGTLDARKLDAIETTGARAVMVQEVERIRTRPPVAIGAPADPTPHR